MENDKPTMPTQITFNYIKGNHFRVIHCDGAIGSPTPQGSIAASFFSQRLPIPQQTTQILKDGLLGDEIMEQRVQREGVMREVEVELIMTAEVARSVADWLIKHADTIDSKNKSVKEQS